MSFQYLSTEILTKIFEYCDILELYNLQQTCKRFHAIIRDATTLGNIRPFLVTNQLTQIFRQRSPKLLTLSEKFFKFKNWTSGHYKEYCLLKEKRKCMPRVVLTKDTLWISRGARILGYKRKAIGISTLSIDFSYTPMSIESDISTFVLKENNLVSGQQDGSIYVQKKDKIDYIENAHESDVHSVDLAGSIFSSGAKNGCLKLWNIETLQTCHSWKVRDRIWSVALSKSCENVAAGSTNYKTPFPLHIFDTNSCKKVFQLGNTLPQCSGMLHLKWESSNILLSSGYDGQVHKWDLRCNYCVQMWKDPFIIPVYSFDTDNYCTLITGVAMNGRTVLWDMRMSSYIQMYFVASCKNMQYSSPVYSLAFDVDHLFAATDYNLNIFNFSVSSGAPVRNYDKSVLPFLV